MNNHGPQWSYSKHKENEILLSQKPELPSCYSRPESIDAWQHLRIYKTLMPILKVYPEATWMTVGDGKFASDAYFLKRNGVDVLSTSLSDDTLAIAKENGYIEKFKSENAESIDLPDNSFDFVLCKESYHHFPRPPIAFYEMLRVARKAVILIEPQALSIRPLNFVKVLVKKVFRGDKTTLYEPGGNFIYRVDVKEFIKMMTALNHKAIAFKRFNDFYHPKLASSTYASSSLHTMIYKLGIATLNILSAAKMMDYGLMTIVAFKEIPSQDLQQELRRNGFKYVCLPRNPYI